MVRVVSDKFRSNGGYRTPPPPRKLLGLMGLVVEERRQAKEWRAASLVALLSVPLRPMKANELWGGDGFR